MTKTAPPKPSADRRTRRQKATRRKLVTATHELVAEHGLDAVTVADITERADVGTGTFYNYFTSREAAIDAVIEDQIATLGRRLDAMSRYLEDPAEIISTSLRHLMGTAISDPVWGKFIVNLGLAHPSLIAILGPRATRDMQIGINADRFDVPNVPMAADIIFGSLLAAIHAHHLSETASSDPTIDLAIYNLRMLGLSPDDASAVSHRPLPALPTLEEALLIPQREGYDLGNMVDPESDSF